MGEEREESPYRRTAPEERRGVLRPVSVALLSATHFLRRYHTGEKYLLVREKRRRAKCDVPVVAWNNTRRIFTWLLKRNGWDT